MSEQSAEIGELVKALAKVQGMMAPVIKGKVNPFFKSKYADLAGIWDALREPLAENGLTVIQTNEGDNPNVAVVVTTLAHTSGQWVRGRLTLPLAKADPQGIGSAITYGRRYALAAMVGVAPEDDDGNAAVRRTAGPPPKEKPPAPVGGTPPPSQPRAPQAPAAHLAPRDPKASATTDQIKAVTTLWYKALGYEFKELHDWLSDNEHLTKGTASELIKAASSKQFDVARFTELTGIKSNAPPDEVLF